MVLPFHEFSLANSGDPPSKLTFNVLRIDTIKIASPTTAFLTVGSMTYEVQGTRAHNLAIIEALFPP
jgi:hypothetical protein